MIRHRLFLILTAAELVALAGLLTWGVLAMRRAEAEAVPAGQAIVRGLGLTDLSVWTEARYTRHPSQADFFSAFQDFPSAPEHFPAGAIIGPPPLRSGPPAVGAGEPR